MKKQKMLRRAMLASIASIVLLYSGITSACESYNPIPVGQFSNAVVDKIGLLANDDPDIVYTIYLESLTTSDGSTMNCGLFTVVWSRAPTSNMNQDEYDSLVQSHMQLEIVKIAKTAFALNLYLQGSVRANAWLPAQSPSIGRVNFISMEKTP